MSQIFELGRDENEINNTGFGVNRFKDNTGFGVNRYRCTLVPRYRYQTARDPV